MRKFTPLLLLLISPLLWAASPKPGSGHTHDGSIRPDMEEMGFYSSSDGVRRTSAMTKAAVSTTGNKKILVILADFGDFKFNKDYVVDDNGANAKDSQVHDKAYYDDLLQGSYGLTMKKFYNQQSRGNLSLSFQVLGPYTADNYFSYYGENDDAENDKRPGTLAQEMMTKVKESGSAHADLDNCAVIIIHSGPGEEENKYKFSDFIWSHKSSLTQQNNKKYFPYEDNLSPVEIVPGKFFDNYIIVPEYTIWSAIGAPPPEETVGVICHEFGHALGLKDAYDTTGATAGVGQWSLMAGGEWGTMGTCGVAPGEDPTPFMAWELAKLGWITERDITPAAGESKYYEFDNMNESSEVYRVNLSNDQHLTFEGMAKNLSGSGMAVYETGLLITQVHEGIIETYSSANRINSTGYRPHGSMVVEAKASNYKANGLGDLWRGSRNTYRVTTTALFRSDTLTSVGPVKISEAELPVLPLFISTIIGSGMAISILLLWYYGRKKLCFAVACAAFAACFSMSCSISGGGGGGGVYDSGPNTNYYTNMSNVHSKTGNSGITIYNIKCNEDGSGSFCVKKE